MDFQEQNLPTNDSLHQGSFAPNAESPLQDDLSQRSQVGETRYIESLIEETASQIASELEDTIPELPEELLIGDATADGGLD